MKKNLIITSLVLLTLVLLSSCIINIEPDPYGPDPKKDEFTFSSVFSGPVTDAQGKKSYQFMCFVTNNTGYTVENLVLKIYWKDQLGDPIFTDEVIIPRLEKGKRWPVGVIHDKQYEITMLQGSTASIKYQTYSSDLERYSVNVAITGHIYHPESGDASFASGYARHNNSYDILDPVVYVVSEVGGKIVEYGIRKYSNIFASGLSTLDFEVTLNPPAKNPKSGRTSYYIVGMRRPL